MIARTSITAYREIKDLDERERRVKAYIYDNPGATAHDIVHNMKMQHTNVCSRLSDLSARGEIMVIGKKKNEATGRMNNQYVVSVLQ